MESKRKEWLDKMKAQRASNSEESGSRKGGKEKRAANAEARKESPKASWRDKVKSKFQENMEKMRAKHKATPKKTD